MPPFLFFPHPAVHNRQNGKCFYHRFTKRSCICIMSTDTTSHEVVAFNVGGKVFEVSHSLLASFPESSLAKKGLTVRTPVDSKNETDMSKSTIFLDRDSDRFRLCLDYMRDGKVHLPIHVSKDALLNELDHYGIAPLGTVESTAIEISGAIVNAASYFRDNFDIYGKEIQEKIASSERQVTELQNRIFAMSLVRESLLEFAVSGMAGNRIQLRGRGPHWSRVCKHKQETFIATTSGIGPIVSEEFAKVGFLFQRYYTIDASCLSRNRVDVRSIATLVSHLAALGS